MLARGTSWGRRGVMIRAGETQPGWKHDSSVANSAKQKWNWKLQILLVILVFIYIKDCSPKYLKLWPFEIAKRYDGRLFWENGLVRFCTILHIFLCKIKITPPPSGYFCLLVDWVYFGCCLCKALGVLMLCRRWVAIQVFFIIVIIIIPFSALRVTGYSPALCSLMQNEALQVLNSITQFPRVLAWTGGWGGGGGGGGGLFLAIRANSHSHRLHFFYVTWLSQKAERHKETNNLKNWSQLLSVTGSDQRSLLLLYISWHHDEAYFGMKRQKPCRISVFYKVSSHHSYKFSSTSYMSCKEHRSRFCAGTQRIHENWVEQKITCKFNAV